MNITQQWSHNGPGFRPCGPTQPKLTPGFYRPILVESMMGSQTFIEPISIVTDDLVMLEDSPVGYVTNSIQRFWKGKNLYAKHGIVHKRGIMLEGPPGTGKTSVANMISKFFVENGGLVFYTGADSFPATLDAVKWLRQIQDEPVLLVMEEFDRYMRHAEVVDALMQLLDGAASVDNVVFLATTNYVKKIDPRFTKRPSRFDDIVHVGIPSATARKSYLQKLIIEFGGDASEVETYVTATDGLLLAHLKEAVIATKVLGQSLEFVVTRLRDMVPKDEEPESGLNPLQAMSLRAMANASQGSALRIDYVSPGCV